jgi:hypothetical protein
MDDGGRALVDMDRDGREGSDGLPNEEDDGVGSGIVCVGKVGVWG